MCKVLSTFGLWNLCRLNYLQPRSTQSKTNQQPKPTTSWKRQCASFVSPNTNVKLCGQFILLEELCMYRMVTAPLYPLCTHTITCCCAVAQACPHLTASFLEVTTSVWHTCQLCRIEARWNWYWFQLLPVCFGESPEQPWSISQRELLMSGVGFLLGGLWLICQSRKVH